MGIIAAVAQVPLATGVAKIRHASVFTTDQRLPQRVAGRHQGAIDALRPRQPPLPSVHTRAQTHQRSLLGAPTG